MTDRAAPRRRIADVAVFGGGVAGLWILHRLRREGLDARLFERGALGDGQTGRSQGIVHRGAKYLLRGPRLDGFPDLWPRWKACLEGSPRAQDPDLKATRVLAPSVWLRSARALPPALEERLERAQDGDLVERAGPGAPAGACYRLLEPVLDPPSLLESLAAPHRSSMHLACDVTPGLLGDTVRLRVDGRELETRQLVLAAGEGNEALLAELAMRSAERGGPKLGDPERGGPGRGAPAMIRRALHMTWVRDADLPPVWQHVLDPEAAPGREGAHFTVTSHPSQGGWSWYVGGDPSELGVERSAAEQIAEVRRLLERNFPDVELDRASWSTERVNRAEPAGPRQLEPFVHRRGRIVTVWPMKLALAPLAADRVHAALERAP